MHRYIRLRKKLLGVDELHMYDIYAPMVSGGEKVIPYAEAKDTVFDALAPMGEKYRAIIREGFDNRWIDVRENVGKRSGAYSAGALCHPYVLLNHKDNLESMFTLAHEMGHAAHSYLSNRTQAPVYRDYVIFVAEVASTCNEALLMEYLLQHTTDKRERAALINHFLEQFKGTLYRQTMFAEFELFMGKLAAEGKTLTGMGSHPPLLLQLLRLSVRHRLLRRHRPVPSHPQGRGERRGGLSGLPVRRLLQGPHRPAQGCWRGHVLSRPYSGRSGFVRHPAGRDGEAHGGVMLLNSHKITKMEAAFRVASIFFVLIP